MARTKTALKGGHAAVYTEKIRLPFSKKTAAKYAKKILSMLNAKCDVNILFVNNAGIQRLNKKYGRKNKPTDVLAFETGDIVISAEMAEKNAAYFGSTAAEELKLYMIHGILHLSGYDDTTAYKRKDMRKAEGYLLNRL